MRAAEMPRSVRYFFALVARRWPSAWLYSMVPRSSQLPSILILTFGCAFSQSAFAFMVSRASGRINDLSKSKYTGCRLLAAGVAFSLGASASGVGTGRAGSAVGACWAGGAASCLASGVDVTSVFFGHPHIVSIPSNTTKIRYQALFLSALFI